jgi:trimeric autotransporter adhesin
MKTSIYRALRRPVIKHALYLGISALTLACVGCGNFFVGPQLTSISIGPPNPTVTVGQTQQMDATGVYDDNSRSPITKQSDWTSSDTAVAMVSSSGLVTGVSIGTSTISAYDLGYSASTTVTVTDANLVSISVTPTGATINPGQSQQFTATGLLQSGNTVDLTNAVTWTSSNTSVATIDGYGLAVGASVSSLSTTDIRGQSGSITSNVVTLTVE